MPSPGCVAGFLAVGLTVSVGLEVLNVYALERWTYAPDMPVLFDVGLAPLLQWLILPPATLWLAQRHLGCIPGWRSLFTDTHA